MQTFYLQYVKCACVCFLQPPIYHWGKHSKTGPKNRRNCVTHSPATLSCMLTRNPRQGSGKYYTLSTLIAASDPRGKPILYTYNNTSCDKGISLNRALTSKWALLQHHSKKVWICWLCGSSGKKQLKGPAPSGVQSTGLDACKD